MSRRTQHERAQLYGRGELSPSTNIADGLTYEGGHETHVLTADSDEAERIKLGILEAGTVGGGIAAGLTYGHPADRAAEAYRDSEINARGQAVIERERLDAEELAVRREAELLENTAEAVYEAARDNFTDPEMNEQAVRYWSALTPEQRVQLVMGGDVEEDVADYLHQRVFPAVVKAQADHNVEATKAANRLQKGIALMRIQEERGLPDAAWNAHKQAVVARAAASGIDLTDESLGSMAFEDNFRAAEVVLAEDARAAAEAQFKLDVLEAPSTSVADGLRVLTGNGWESTQEGGPVYMKPDYERAAARVLGGGNGPEFDRADDIKAGILGTTDPSEGREWREVQTAAGELFSAAEEARIAAKLGER
jgi:hypothetical protein